MDVSQASTSTTAVISLVSGILAWAGLPLFGALVAVVSGHLARGEIRRSGGVLQGDGLALTGLILGWAQLAIIALVLLLWLAAAVVLGIGFGLLGQ